MPSTTSINAHSPEHTAEARPKQTAEAGLGQSLRITSTTEPTMTTRTEECADPLGLYDGYPDLQLLDCIKMSRHREVYRAVSKKYGPCIVKATTSTPTQVEIKLLRNEFGKLRMCSSANIVSAHNLYQRESSLGAALVTEDCGLSLRSWAKIQPAPPPLETILDIGIQIAEGLDNLHRVARLIHSDLNPDNVCWDFKKARIINLGAAHGLLEHFTTVTVAYQSPEQARGLTDHRSDLYSLGILLFELYTQHLPIQGSLHRSFRLAHMLDPPLVVSAVRECHPMFEKIVARLLVKVPEKRYMTAAGLRYDLEQLLVLIKTDTLGAETFALGSREVPFILMLPNELIGRSAELSTLNKLYENCLDPEQGGFCYLEGKPGVGKTALIEAFAAQRQNPFFFTYKLNQFGNTPMLAIIKIMSHLVHQTVQSKEFSNVKLRGAFLERLRKCDVLRSLVDIVPAYAKLITTTKPIPEAIGDEVRNILYPAIAHVLIETRKFCGKPIFAFFDDVQWIDPGTKGVLSYLLEHNVPILMIVAYRDRSSQSTFALESLLSRGDTKSLPIQPVGLALHDLREEDTRELINHLALSDEDKNTLSGALFRQTEGNPFFLRFRLTTMAETGALSYDVDSRLWRLDKSRVALTTAVTAEDAVEYCAATLRTLDYEVTSVLCRLAMMPQGLSLDEYSATLEHEKGLLELAKSKSATVAEMIRTAVTFSVQKSLLYHGGRGFRFAHDRLQNAAAQCASPKEAAEIHYYLGENALATGQCSSEQAYQVLDHFSKSREFVTDPDLILRIGTLVPEICAFYVTAGSHEQLDTMLHFARELLEKLDDEKRNSDAFSSLEVRLLIAHHRIKFLMNDIDAAEMLFDDVRPRLQTPADIRDAYEVRISLLINSASHHKAIEATAEALALLDERSLPKELVLADGQLATLVGEVTQEIKDLSAELAYSDAMQVANSLAVSEDENHSFRVEIMISVISSMYLIGRFDLYMYVPALACRSILKNGVTRSAGNAFSVLGFALVAIFGDSFGAEVAMIGKHLVDRFDNHACMCGAYCMSGIAVIFDQRYDKLASQLLYASYTAGRTAHDIVWANYSIYLLSGMFIFEGVALAKILDKLEDLNAYAMSSGHQALTQRALRSTLHTVSILMQGKSTEEPVFHFTIPNDEITKAQPLLGLSHGTLAMVALFFDEKLEIAWQIVSEILENGLDKSAPGLPIFFIFHLYATVVAHGVLIGSMVSGDGEEGSHSISEQDRDKLREVMKSSSKIFDNLNGMAPIFTPFAHVAKACIADAIDDKPLDALQLFDSAVAYVSTEKPGKHADIVAISQLISASICRRAKLTSIQTVYFSSAICTLEQWGAHHVAERLSKEIKNYTGSGSQRANAGSSQAGSAHLLTPDGSNFLKSADRVTLGSSIRLTTPSSEYPSYTPRLDPKHAPDFASVLTIASYITSFSSFDELTEKLSSTLLKQATATRFLLLMRHPDTSLLEPTAQYTLEGMSPPDTLRNAKYSIPIVKVTEQLQEIVVVHSAQQESPYCFQPYIKESGVCSVASLPIIYQNSLVAIIYMEHEFTQGVFTMEIMSTMALLGQHVASAIVNARLLRDNRKRTTQLEHSHANLAKALRVKDTILSNTSHELRTPLSGIIGLNENVLNSSIALHPEVQSCMDTTLVLARDLLSLVSDILDMQRVNEGALRLKYKPTSLHSLVKNVLDVSKFTSKQIRLVNDISKSFPKIMVDPARFKQVIFNLTANAVKFTSEGSVTIASELLDDGRMIMVTVTDTGIGIDPAHFDLVFKAFEQVESYETRQHEGTGLGLSITKELVMLHGGRIDLLSKVGKGTSFRVFIPTTPPDLSEANDSDGDDHVSQTVSHATTTIISHPEIIPEDFKGQQEYGIVPDKVTSAMIVNRDVKRDEAAGGSIYSPSSSMGSIVAVEGEEEEDLRSDSINQEPLRVLVVDDSRVNLKIMANILCKADMEVTTVDSGRLLLHKLVGDQWLDYDVILLDWMMPVMDGITACRLVRKRIACDLLPIMFLTAKTEPADITKAFGAGATDYATKPFNRYEVVARTVSLGRAARRARARCHDSIPIVSKDSFWKMQPMHPCAVPMFVICFQSWFKTQEGPTSAFDGPHLLHSFRLGAVTFKSEWKFCEVTEDSVSFFAAQTTAQEATAFLHIILEGLEGWAESELINSAAVPSFRGAESRCKPWITVGVDHRIVRTHLFAEQLPMLAAVESCASDAKLLASKGTQHEEILLSESAKAALTIQRQV